MEETKAFPLETVSTVSKKVPLDELMEETIGGFGRYHMILVLLVSSPIIGNAAHVLSWTFIGSEQVFPGNSSIYSQWDISPESRSSMKSNMQSFYFVGHFVGACVTGTMGDRYGRKFTMTISLLLQAICGLLLSVASNWWAFAILKLAVGFSHPGVYCLSVIYCMEIVGRSYRHLCAILANTCYAIGTMFIPLAAYFVKDHQICNAVLSIPSFFFFFYWAIPESPQWLLAKGKIKEVEKIVRRAANVNGREFPDNWTSRLDITPAQNQISSGVVELFKTPEIRKRILISTLIWPAGSMVYYALTMRADLNGGSIYTSFALSSFMDLPGVVICLLLLNVCGRKLLQSIPFTICGILLLLNWIFSSYASNIILLSLLLIAKVASTCTSAASYTHLPEMMPTLLRNTSMGYGGAVARFGSILSSYISFWLVDHFGVAGFVLPLSTLSLISAGLIQFLLPETKGKPLPETVDDVEKEVDSKSYKTDQDFK